jgi:hypothetical protein
MSRVLLWDAGPGEVRAGIVEQGQLVELHILRPRRDGTLLAAGEFYTARVLRSLGQNKAQVTLGGPTEAILQPAKGFGEGTLLAAEMTRAPIPEPGRWKLPVVRPAPATAPQSEPGWHFSDEPSARFLRQLAPGLDAILCPDAQSLNEVRTSLGPAGPAVQIDPVAIDEADFPGLIEAAVLGEYAIAQGQISIERTRAMTMIDVDGSGDPLALNIAAAREAARLLLLLGIGGPVGIDFVTLDDRKARATLDAALGDACGPLGPHKRTAMNGFGFVQIIRTRSGPSIPELICTTTPGRLSLESRAVALLREAGRSTGHGKRQLVAPPAVIDLIRQWGTELASLKKRLGTEIELVADPASFGYGHVHVSQS